MKVGEVIRYYREKTGYSQKELAEKVHMSVRTIGHYETGTRSPSIEVMKQLAKVLHVRPADFLLPLPVKEEKYVFYDSVWIYHCEEEKGEHVLKPDTYVKDYQQEENLLTRIGNDIVYFPIQNVVRIVSEVEKSPQHTSIVEEKEISIIELLETKENKFVIVKVGNRKEEFAIAIDSAIEVVYGMQTCQEINEETKHEIEKEKEREDMSMTLLILGNSGHIMREEKIVQLSEHATEYMRMLKGNFSTNIKKIKIYESLELIEQLLPLSDSYAAYMQNQIDDFAKNDVKVYTIEQIQSILLNHLHALE